MTTSSDPSTSSTDARTHEIEVSDIFRSIQGEGPHAGTPSIFVRTRRCNLSCSWCDTRYTWDGEAEGYTKYESLDVHQIFMRCAELAAGDVPPHLYLPIAAPAAWVEPVRHLVLTGGEPLLWANQLTPLIEGIHRDLEWTIEVETNGTIPPPSGWSDRVHYNVSPKMLGAGMGHQRPWQSTVLNQYLEHDALLKLVVANSLDFAMLTQGRLIDRLMAQGWARNRIWLMPEGRDVDTLRLNGPPLMRLAEELDVQYSSRMHVAWFGDHRAT